MIDIDIWEPISEGEPSRMVSSANKAHERGVSVTVLRMDCMKKWDVTTARHMASAIKGRCYASVRSAWQGGFFTGDEKDMLDSLILLMDSGFDGLEVAADMDASVLRKISLRAREKGVRLAYTFSSFAWPLPADAIESMVSGVYNPGDVFFFEAPAKNRSDVQSLLEASRGLSKNGLDINPSSMGSGGLFLSLTAPALGLKRYRNAEGEKNNEEMHKVWSCYRWREKPLILDGAKIIGGIEHYSFPSAMPDLYGRALAKLEPAHLYVPMLWGKQKVEDFIDMAIDMSFLGFHLGPGLQKPILDALDTVDRLAKQIMAVDTVAVRGDELVGVNTRHHGYLGLAEEIPFSLKDSRVLVLGTSGELRSAASAFLKMGTAISYSSPLEQDRELMAEAFESECQLLPWAKRQRYADDADIIVVTPMLKFREFPLDTNSLQGKKVLIDLYTYPPLDHDSRTRGSTMVLNALDIFPYQASTALSFWTGGTVTSESVFRELVRSKERK